MLEKKTKYNVGDILAVTVKPDNTMQGKISKTKGTERLLDFYQTYRDKMIRLLPSDHYDYWLRLEVSEPIGLDIFAEPRMHLHGVIKLNTRYAVLHLLLDVMPDILQHARLQIAHMAMDKDQTWIAYCRKQSMYIPRGISCLTNHDKEIEDWLMPPATALG